MYTREDIGPVEEIRDAPEPLRLALRAIDAPRKIDPLQRRICFRIDERRHLERKRCLWWRYECQASIIDNIGRASELFAVEKNALQLQELAVQLQRNLARRLQLRIAPDRQLGNDAGARRIKRNVEIHGIDEEVRRSVIRKQNWLRVF